LRNDSAIAVSSATSTTSVGRGCSQASSSARAWLVFGSSKVIEFTTAIEPRSACIDRALRSAARCSLRLTLKV
jgi:hypothetical protein